MQEDRHDKGYLFNWLVVHCHVHSRQQNGAQAGMSDAESNR